MTMTQPHPDSLRFTLGVAIRIIEICEETLYSINVPDGKADLDDVLCRVSTFLDGERPNRERPTRA
jgi:hypothetical protein